VAVGRVVDHSGRIAVAAGLFTGVGDDAGRGTEAG
jgi:hypothetical protein